MTLSLCTIVWDEEMLLPGMLDSVAGVVDEIWLGIDSRTTDSTLEVATRFAERTLVDTHALEFDWHDSFADARNLVLERCRGDWILALDADERLTQAGFEAIHDVLTSDIPLWIDGYRPMSYETTLDGELISEALPLAPRLFRNSPDLRYIGRVHEELRYVPDPPRTSCEMLPAGAHIQHLGSDPTILELRRKIARDRRLLHMRLCENPHDAVAYYYLATEAQRVGRYILAKTCAARALRYGPLHDEAMARLVTM